MKKVLLYVTIALIVSTAICAYCEIYKIGKVKIACWYYTNESHLHKKTVVYLTREEAEEFLNPPSYDRYMFNQREMYVKFGIFRIGNTLHAFSPRGHNPVRYHDWTDEGNEEAHRYYRVTHIEKE